MQIQIRKAEEKDIDAVSMAYTELLEYESKNRSFSNWKLGVYPTRKTAEKTVSDGTLYVMEIDGKIVSSVILNSVQPTEHERINWKYVINDKDVLVIHTLCVAPSQARHGYGRKMMEYAVWLAKNEGYKALRLDTYEGNYPAHRLYEKLGFSLAGSACVKLEGLIDETLKYYEYLIS